eukprot:29297-Amphidinium_carterae.1
MRDLEVGDPISRAEVHQPIVYGVAVGLTNRHEIMATARACTPGFVAVRPVIAWALTYNLASGELQDYAAYILVQECGLECSSINPAVFVHAENRMMLAVHVDASIVVAPRYEGEGSLFQHTHLVLLPDRTT